MIDNETKYKAECVYNELSMTALRIIKEFTEILEISDEDARNIITSNITAITFLLFESSLKLYGDEKCIEMLMKATLFRQWEYTKAITDDEIDRIKECYGFTVTRSSPSVTCKI